MNAPSQEGGRLLRGDHCQCAGCGLYFNSTYAFDRHRAGRHGVDRRCLTEVEMLAAGMGLNEGGWWISERMDPQKARLGMACDSRQADPSQDGAQAGSALSQVLESA